MTPRRDTDVIKAANPPESVMTRLTLNPTGRKRLKALCPHCGKADKFDVHRTSGAFNCFSCDLSGGDVIALAMAVLGLDFIAACDWLGGDAGLSDDDRQRLADEQAERDQQARIDADRKAQADKAQMSTVLKGLTPGAGTPVQTYLEGRGLGRALRALGWVDDTGSGGWPRDIAFHPSLDLFGGPKGKRVKVGMRPAMVMIARDARGQVACLHRTFLDIAPDGCVTKVAGSAVSGGKTLAVKAKQVLGPVGRATRGVHLGTTAGITDDPRACSYVAEGIENALAVAASGLPGDYYTALNLGRLVGKACPSDGDDGGFAFPPDGRPRVILADNDLSPTLAWPDFKDGEAPEVTGDLRFGGVRRGQSEMKKALKRFSADGDSVAVSLPPRGMDFNDWLLAQPEPEVA